MTITKAVIIYRYWYPNAFASNASIIEPAPTLISRAKKYVAVDTPARSIGADCMANTWNAGWAAP